MFKEKFTDIDAATDERLSRVKIILASPQCSRSAIANPVDFMLNEGDTDMTAVFRDLSNHRQNKSVAKQVGTSHTNVLANAMKCKFISYNDLFA